MTDEKKTTEASAVELDENELDKANGGLSFTTLNTTSFTSDYLKLGDIKGESLSFDHKMGDIKITR